MKKQFFLVLLLAVFSLILVAQNIKAQEGISVYSTVNYDANNNSVTGHSYTYATYGNSGYYNTEVTSFLVDSDYNVLTSNTAYGNLQAILLLAATGRGCDEYRILSSHRTTTQYYVTAFPYDGGYRDGYYDVFDYLFSSEQGQIEDYVNSIFFSALTNPRVLDQPEIYLGSTEHTSIGNCAPPSVEISTIGSIEKGGTKNVNVTVSNAKNKKIIFGLSDINQVSGGVTFDDGAYTKTITPTSNQSVTLTYTLKAHSASSQLDDHRLRAYFSDGTELKRQLFTIISVGFEEASNCSGFDKVENPPYLSVPKSGTNTVKANIIPNGATGSFNLQLQSGSGISVSPTSISSSGQTLTITGGTTTGNFTVQAFANQATSPAATLNIAVLKRIDKTVKIYAITEDNDDVQAMNPGAGSKGTSAACVTSGTNGFRDTLKNGDDDYLTDPTTNLDYISVGANRICDTTANNIDVLPSSADIPSETALETALNSTYWGKQANVHFTVARDNTAHQVNFDLNRDNLLENTSGGGETGEIIRNVRDSNYQIHLYYTSLDISTYSIRQTEAFAFGTSAYFSKRHKDSVNNLAAHEIGHILGRSGHNSALGTLMLEFSGHPGYPDPCRILKTDWDLVNPNTP